MLTEIASKVGRIAQSSNEVTQVIMAQSFERKCEIVNDIKRLFQLTFIYFYTCYNNQLTCLKSWLD